MSASESSQTANDRSAITAMSDTDFDGIEVELRFELAHRSLPLGDIAALAAGTVIELGLPIEDPAVLLWVEQRCVGKGQLVAVGEKLGVRLLTTFEDETASALPRESTHVESAGNSATEGETTTADSTGNGRSDAEER